MTELEQAAEDAVVALNDWLHLYAREFHGVGDAKRSRQRIDNAGGTVAYIVTLRERLEKALKK